MKHLFYLLSLLFLFSCLGNGRSGEKSAGKAAGIAAVSTPVEYGYRVVNTWPHDPQAYTQGLYWHDGFLYEGTGLNGKSSLRKIELATGNVLKQNNLDENYFGEGIALLDGKIYQLTWQNRRGFIYDAETFERTGEFGYDTEGWGLTTDGKLLYMSDGTDRIFVMGQDMKRIKTLTVSDHRSNVRYINEMEWIEGEIWANIYTTQLIVRINPETGRVTGIIDLTGLVQLTDITPDTDVLNGIAYDPDTKRIFVTGKNWNKLFQIEVFKK